MLDDDRSADTGPSPVGGYEPIAEIGRGASAVVWRAVGPPPLRREVALKRARPGAVPTASGLRREAELLRRIDHPHVIALIDEVDDGDDVALVVPLARGGSLHDLLSATGPMAPGQVVAVVAPVADALAAVHRAGVTHGDLTPANVLLGDDGDPVLADLGVARALTATAAADDVRALAAVAHECLTGRPVAAERPPSGADGPDALVAVISAALAAHVGDELSDAARLATALRQSVDPGSVVLPAPRGALAAGPGSAIRRPGAPARPVASQISAPLTRPFGPTPPNPRTTATRRRRRVVVAATLAAVVSLAGTAAIVGRGDDAASPARPATTDGGPAGPVCAEPEPLALGAGETRRVADLDGDGCLAPVAWDGGVLRVPDGARSRRYRVRPETGGEGQLLLGDWNCDGTDTPAYYQPDVGVVSVFGALPEAVGEPLRPVARRASPRHAIASVTSVDGCDEVVVEPTA